MRFVIGLLGILFLWMNSIPCADEALGKCESTITATQTGGGVHNDACSPFCNCSCCSCFSIPTHQVFESVTKLSISEYSSVISAEIVEISLPIWQPPQLG